MTKNKLLKQVLTPFRVALLFGSLLFSVGAVKANDYFSMCSDNNVLSNPMYLAKMAEAGVHTVRIDSLTFPSVRKDSNQSPDRWNWSSAEAVRNLTRSHPGTSWLAILGYGIKWAEDPKFSKNSTSINAPQRGINIVPPESPDNLYGNYVYETVRRYKDCIHMWESWNEPDLPGNNFFNGNGHDFMPYQRACYLAAKHADPNCTVAFAGLSFANIEGYLFSHHLNPPTYAPAKASFFEEYLQEVVKDPNAKSNNYYFDVMNQHSYSRATDLADYSQVQKKLMRDYLGQEKPLWFTETGFVDGGGAWGGTPDDYCDYLIQSYCWAMLSGVQRNFHFQLDNSNQHGLFTGMLGVAKPAYQTYKMLTYEFGDAQFVKQLHGRAGVGLLQGNSPYHPSWTTGYNLFELKSKDGQKRLLVAFTDTSKPIDISVPATKSVATLIDRHGNQTPIRAINSMYQLHLAGATNVAGFPVLADPRAKAMGMPEHLVGGASQIIVE